MKWIQKIMVITMLIIGLDASGFAQESQDPAEKIGEDKFLQLSGPRVGLSIFFGEGAQKIKAKTNSNLPIITHIGYQFEFKMNSESGSFAALGELLPMISGLERGNLIPSLNGMFGMRQSKGFEVGAGLSLSTSGIGFLLGAGVSMEADEFNFPLNVIYSSNKQGSRVTFLTGFNSDAL